jgi:branched-chain amino acid transport system permease protein
MEQLVESTIRGLGQGSLYTLLGLGFVIVYRSTGVVNFAQPALMILGAYWTSYFAVTRGLPFWVGLGLAFIVLQVIAGDLIGLRLRHSGDPWGLERLQVGGIDMFQSNVARIAITAAVVALLGLFLKYTRAGLAMRATALNQETALAQGVPVGRVFALSWALAGALAAVAGMFVGAGGAGFNQETTFIALKALPAIILGGLDSIRGAVVGGLAIGLGEAYTKAYQADHFPWLGANFDQVVPYLLMLLVLLVRPYGLFGTREVERV